MIEIEGLSFRYKRKKAIYQKLNVSIAAGHIYGLLGKNGAGKSTLLKNMIGLLFPFEGTIKVNGFTPGKRQPAFLETIYFIPEEVFVPAVTISGYLSLYSRFYPKFNEAEFYRHLSDLDVKNEGKLNTFSFGQQKKFIIAFALACNTGILLLDEPTNGLDIPSKVRFRKLIASTMNEERIIFISTHQIRDLDNLIDNIIIVDNGKLLLNSSLDEISEKVVFKTVTTPISDEVLYAEETLRGTSVIMKNTDDEHSMVNIEQLFNAMTERPELSKLFITQE